MQKIRENDLPHAKEYAGKVKRLAISLIRHGYNFDQAVAFIESARGIKEDNKAGLAIWFHDNLPKLENSKQYKSICEACACCLGGKRKAAALAINKECQTVAERVARFIKTPYIVGDHGEIIDDHTFIVYYFNERTFYRCPCLKFEENTQPVDIPEGYCYCCCGHLAHHAETALGKHVNVELITSSLCTKGQEGC